MVRRSDGCSVGPSVTYGVGRVQQEFGIAGIDGQRSGVDAASQCARQAIRWPICWPATRSTYGADTLMRFKDGEYEFVWAGLGTFVSGEAKAIESIQRAPEHYMQRPDKDYVPLDPYADVARRLLANHELQSHQRPALALRCRRRFTTASHSRRTRSVR